MTVKRYIIQTIITNQEKNAKKLSSDNDGSRYNGVYMYLMRYKIMRYSIYS